MCASSPVMENSRGCMWQETVQVCVYMLDAAFDIISKVERRYEYDL